MHYCLILIWNTCYETKKRITSVFIHPWILQQKARLSASHFECLRHSTPSALDAFGVTRRGAKRLRRFAPAALVAGGLRHKYLNMNWNWFQERECLRRLCKTMFILVWNTNYQTMEKELRVFFNSFWIFILNIPTWYAVLVASLWICPCPCPWSCHLWIQFQH